jgi:NAD+ kinase
MNPSAPRKIVITSHPRSQDTLLEAEMIANYLRDVGIEATWGPLNDELLRNRVNQKEFDLLIALGGDGTMLRAGHLCAPIGLPILGINKGHFGFLMEIQLAQWKECLPDLMNGRYWLEQRMMLTIEQWRDEQLMGSWIALNEVVVSRGQYVRPIRIRAQVDGRFLATYVADALIASTPTGSTAYALAAGGPILPPELRNILLVAVAPHLSLDRALVLAEGSSVSMSVDTDHEAVFSIDGQPPLLLNNGDRVEARASEHTLQFIRFQDPGYFYRNLTPHMNQNPSTGLKR